MKLIVGLGNPGPQYENTRHNIGWMALDEVAKRHNIAIQKGQQQSLLGSGFIDDQKVLLVKPLTYMNLSGQAAQAVARYYHIALKDVLIICDDLNLNLGRLRLRPRGSDGGHNGLKSIAQSLGTTEYARLRCGVGQPPQQERREHGTKDFVLGKFSAEDNIILQDQISRAASCVEAFAVHGTVTAMNQFNG